MRRTLIQVNSDALNHGFPRQTNDDDALAPTGADGFLSLRESHRWEFWIR